MHSTLCKGHHIGQFSVRRACDYQLSFRVSREIAWDKIEATVPNGTFHLRLHITETKEAKEKHGRARQMKLEKHHMLV